MAKFKRRLIWILILTVFIGMQSCNLKKKGDSITNNSISTVELRDNWKIISSDNISSRGEDISKADFIDNGWISAKVPSTIMGNLVNANFFDDIFVGHNLKDIDKEQFKKSWWYRKEFLVNKLNDNFYNLLFEGINYKANIWLNGKLIADENTFETPYKMFEYAVTSNLVDGKNVLAVEIIPPVKGNLTIGFVDWNHAPTDENMGIWRPVKLITSGVVRLKDIFVKSDLDETFTNADLTISTSLINHKNVVVKAKLIARIGGVEIEKEVNLKPNQKREIVLNSKEFDNLTFINPELWWPNGLGEPNMYNANLELYVDGVLTDKSTTRFGIRDVKQYVTEDGFKGWMINGNKTYIKGAGWVDDLFLNDSDQKVKDQLAYVKDMNLNTVRLEGFWGENKTLFDTADELGLLLMVGWSCHWEWTEYCHRPETDEYMCITTEEDMVLQSDGYKDQVVWLRNHPSVFLWVYGSDKMPLPKLEKKLDNIMNDYDGTRPSLISCREHTSELSGYSGVKMRGPYGYVTPSYWYVDDRFGGAFGFNTETGPGPQVPPLESIKRMIPEENLWPMDSVWTYHLGRNSFGTLDRYINAFNNRYGESNSVEDFATYSQLSNYEAIRPMFEAFSVNRYKSTGVIQWMLNSAWPEMYWQLYDYYMLPNGAYYGTKKACEPLNIVYNYGDNSIYLTNELLQNQEELTATVKVLDINSKEVYSKSFKTQVERNTSSNILTLPDAKNNTNVYFVYLKLEDSKGNEVTNQLYWLSTTEEQYDWETTNWFITNNTKYANYTPLRNLGKADVSSVVKYTDKEGSTIASVTLTNNSDKLAFFIEMNINDGSQSILPVQWSDNYVSLLPNTSKIFTAKIVKTDHSKIKLKLNGINL